MRTRREAIASLAALLAAMAAAQQHTEPRQSAPAPADCEQSKEHRQLDFWVGEWVVTSQGEKVGESSVQPVVRSCAIVESWTSVKGALGKSLNYFDPSTRKWHQNWVNDTGQISQFTGEFREGAMRLEGTSTLPDGRKVMRRMVLMPLPIGVRQTSEFSEDGGKTWKPAYDFLYTGRR